MVHLFPNAQIQNRFLQKKWTISSTEQHCDIEWLSFYRPEENTHTKKAFSATTARFEGFS